MRSDTVGDVLIASVGDNVAAVDALYESRRRVWKDHVGGPCFAPQDGRVSFADGPQQFHVRSDFGKARQNLIFPFAEGRQCVAQLLVFECWSSGNRFSIRLNESCSMEDRQQGIE